MNVKSTIICFEIRNLNSLTFYNKVRKPFYIKKYSVIRNFVIVLFLLNKTEIISNGYIYFYFTRSRNINLSGRISFVLYSVDINIYCLIE